MLKDLNVNSTSVRVQTSYHQILKCHMLQGEHLYSTVFLSKNQASKIKCSKSKSLVAAKKAMPFRHKTKILRGVLKQTRHSILMKYPIRTCIIQVEIPTSIYLVFHVFPSIFYARDHTNFLVLKFFHLSISFRFYFAQIAFN